MVTKLEALKDVAELISAIEDPDGNYMFVNSCDNEEEFFACEFDFDDTYRIAYQDIIDSNEYVLYKEVQVDLIYDNED